MSTPKKNTRSPAKPLVPRTAPQAEALPAAEAAAAVDTAPPPVAVPETVTEAAKPVRKAGKVKLVRDSFAMPETEYAQIAVLKKRLAALGGAVKKSELLRGGLLLLAALDDAELQAVLGRVERIKTGRPGK